MVKVKVKKTFVKVKITISLETAKYLLELLAHTSGSKGDELYEMLDKALENE
jgi:hypothetical protein